MLKKATPGNMLESAQAHMCAVPIVRAHYVSIGQCRVPWYDTGVAALIPVS